MLPTSLKPVSLKIDARTISQFAALTGDFNPIHLDEAFARATPMNGIIAHGTLSSNLLWRSFEETFPLEHLHFEIEVRYLKAVRVGAVVTCGGRLIGENPIEYEVWVSNEKDEVMISGRIVACRKAEDAVLGEGDGP